MSKKIALAILVGVLLIPAVSAASYRLGFGGRVDPISGGLEFRAFIPLKGETAWFIAAHGIGIFTSEADYKEILYSAGLRTGLVFSQGSWLSPYVGIGGGSSGEVYGDEKYIGMGGRIFVGLSLAPLQLLVRDEERAYESGRLKMDFDSGFFYRVNKRTFNQGTFEDTRTRYWFPDIGFGISFNW